MGGVRSVARKALPARRRGRNRLVRLPDRLPRFSPAGAGRLQLPRPGTKAAISGTHRTIRRKIEIGRLPQCGLRQHLPSQRPERQTGRAHSVPDEQAVDPGDVAKQGTSGQRHRPEADAGFEDRCRTQPWCERQRIAQHLCQGPPPSGGSRSRCPSRASHLRPRGNHQTPACSARRRAPRPAKRWCPFPEAPDGRSGRAGARRPGGRHAAPATRAPMRRLPRSRRRRRWLRRRAADAAHGSIGYDQLGASRQLTCAVPASRATQRPGQLKAVDPCRARDVDRREIGAERREQPTGFRGRTNA